MTKNLALADHKETTADVTKAVTKQEKILEAQRKHKDKVELEVTAKQREGELLYENYADLKTLLENMKADWKKLNLGQIRDKYSTHPLVRKINDDGTIEVELGESE
jgi:predicted ribosome quality control (RQC) complex YloA/Tae2 family protein